MNRMNRPPAMSQADLYRGEVGMGTIGQPPPSKKGWSQFGQVQAGDTNNTSQVGCQATFDEAGAYTLSFSIVPPIVAGIVQNVRADALISWSVAGNTVNRRITIGNGASISGVAEAVSVKIIDTSDPAFFGGSALMYTVGVTIAPGTRAAYNQPPTLLPSPSVVGNGAQIQVFTGAVSLLTVPQNAGIISVHVSVGSSLHEIIPDNSISVVQIATGAVLRKTYDPRATDWEPVDAGIIQLSLQNNMAGAGSVFFSVAFGVDG